MRTTFGLIPYLSQRVNFLLSIKATIRLGIWFIGKCSFCHKKNMLCEVSINSKGDKVNVCEKCEAGEEEQEGYYAKLSFNNSNKAITPFLS